MVLVGTTLLLAAQLSAQLATTVLPAARAVVSDTVPVVTAPARPLGGVPQPGQFDASRFDSLTAISLRSIFDEAYDRGLPVRLLVNRALEGAARRVSGPRILRVVREFSDALAAAKFALGDGSTEAELDAAATAIRAGIEPRTIAGLRTTRPAGTAVTALVVLTDLVGRGVPLPTAREAVTTLATQSRSDESLTGLQQTVAKNSQRGPGMALDALNRYVRGTTSGAVPPGGSAGKPVRPPDP
jgi:hypothetical protein